MNCSYPHQPCLCFVPAQGRWYRLSHIQHAVVAAGRHSEDTVQPGVQAYAKQKEAEQASQEATEAAAARPPKEAGTYAAPAWGGVPEGIPFSVEIMKNGAIVERRDVAAKAAYTFGRAPNYGAFQCTSCPAGDHTQVLLTCLSINFYKQPPLVQSVSGV